ncbi:hypothetical protein [Agarilytica rhodophyticola]|uniref:hypothetical protein n=1 Tax=Agarilytica rhodophyticola TaxID=1737490 RepID=UPI000B341D9B|nr:hypothetical protein [Agarilytica rhodophyticola]
MKEPMTAILEQLKLRGKIDHDQLSENFVYIGPSKMLTTDVWKELSKDSEEMHLNILMAVCEKASGAILFEFQDEMTMLTCRMSWFLKFDESGLLLELVETKEAVETVR